MSSIKAHSDLLKVGVNVEDRTLYILGGIDSESTCRVWLGLQALISADKTAPIKVHLSSEGGDVECGLAIYDMLRGTGCKVHIHVLGYAHSMGIIILQAGDYRTISPNGAIMAHWGRQGVEDTNPENYRRKQQFQSDLDDKCDLILLNRMRIKKPKTTLNKIKKLTANDWYLHPEDAIANGFIDAIQETM